MCLPDFRGQCLQVVLRHEYGVVFVWKCESPDTPLRVFSSWGGDVEFLHASKRESCHMLVFWIEHCASTKTGCVELFRNVFVEQFSINCSPCTACFCWDKSCEKYVQPQETAEHWIHLTPDTEPGNLQLSARKEGEIKISKQEKGIWPGMYQWSCRRTPPSCTLAFLKQINTQLNFLMAKRDDAKVLRWPKIAILSALGNILAQNVKQFILIWRKWDAEALASRLCGPQQAGWSLWPWIQSLLHNGSDSHRAISASLKLRWCDLNAKRRKRHTFSLFGELWLLAFIPCTIYSLFRSTPPPHPWWTGPMRRSWRHTSFLWIHLFRVTILHLFVWFKDGLSTTIWDQANQSCPRFSVEGP